MPGHHYRELAPAAALRPFVECYWRATSEGAPVFRPLELLVPDLRVELIFNAGEAWRWETAAGRELARAPVMGCIGMRGRALGIQQPGRLDHFAIRFRPGGLAAFTPVALSELTQRCWDMQLLWPRTAHELAERLYAAGSDDARVQISDRFLQERLGRLTTDTELALSAARALVAGRGRPSIAALAEDHGVHYKRLERIFARRIGLSPKHFARVARLQYALELATAQPRTGFAALAALSGYSDQAHFNRDFRVLIGRTPGAFFAERFAVYETMAASGSLTIKPYEDDRA